MRERELKFNAESTVRGIIYKMKNKHETNKIKTQRNKEPGPQSHREREREMVTETGRESATVVLLSFLPSFFLSFIYCLFSFVFLFFSRS